MRLRGVWIAFVLATTACAPGIRVSTAVSPRARLANRQTFRVLPTPEPRAPVRLAVNDPMLANSPSNRALHDNLREGFESRGYVVADSSPDFAIASYASATQKLDIKRWNYGYAWSPPWWRGWGPGWGALEAEVGEYAEGTVIIDVIDPKTRELLWRGRGASVVPDNPQAYLRELKRTVMAILAEFPRAETSVAEAP